MMTTEKKIIYLVEGPDWNSEVELNSEIFESESEQLFEAGTRAIEIILKDNGQMNIGPIILIKKQKSTREAMVSSYICLNNSAHYDMAENLRKNFKSSSGQDLALDKIGYTY